MGNGVRVESPQRASPFEASPMTKFYDTWRIYISFYSRIYCSLFLDILVLFQL